MVTLKNNTHIVIKNTDAKKYLSEEEYQMLEKMLCKIGEGRIKDNKKPVNDYYICNKDEPYAEMVHGVIIGGEYQKKLDNRQKEIEDENGFSDYWEEN